MADDRISIEIADHVADVRMVRADKHNALDADMFLALDAALARLRGEGSVRAVVLSGEGPSFCSGLDVASFMGGTSSLTMEDLIGRPERELANLAQRVACGWLTLPMPVIAALHGACFGGGCQIALGADVRIAAPGTRMSVMEMRWGLIPDMGITQTLPRLVRMDVAKELTFTNRVVEAEEAAALGLVTRVAEDPVAAARELADEIAARSPDAIRAAKRLINETWLATPADGLLLETELQRGLLGSPNQLEAVRAGFAKEPASFADPA